ncbi:MAG: DctP family TRAP transporter solute-binding subunit [Paenibacillaceae bacterium]
MKTIARMGMIVLLAIGLAACSTKDDEKPIVKVDDKPIVKVDEKPIIIKFSHVTAPGSVKGKAADKFAELVAEKTEGRVKVEVFPSSQLYGDADELDALISGNVQMIAPSVTKMVKLDPRWQFVDMPYLFQDEDHARKFFNSDLGKNLLAGDKLVANDILGLVFWENGFKHLMNNKKPLQSVADFKGMKFRVQAGKVLEGQFKALGAGSATIAFGETYAALQQGTVDGTENTFNNMDTQKYQEVQKYLTVSEHGRLDYGVFVNQTFWKGMPADIRAKVEEALKEATELEWQLAHDENMASFENMKNAGKVQINVLTKEQRAELEEAFKDVYSEFTSLITPELIDGIRQLK